MANVPGLREWSNKNFELNGLNAGDLNNFANVLRNTIRQMSNPADAGMLIAEQTRKETMRYVKKDAFTDFDGNKINDIVIKKTAYGGTVSMKSPHKERSEYPDAYYLEYGYGSKGRDNVAYQEGAAPSGWEPASMERAELGGRGTDDFWFYYDQYGVKAPRGSARRSEYQGYKGQAAMYKGRRWAKRQLRDKNSRLCRIVRDKLGL